MESLGLSIIMDCLSGYDKAKAGYLILCEYCGGALIGMSQSCSGANCYSVVVDDCLNLQLDRSSKGNIASHTLWSIKEAGE